jgi:hypothetical protein
MPPTTVSRSDATVQNSGAMRLYEKGKTTVKRWAWQLDHQLTCWPLGPPPVLCWRSVWVGLGLAVCGLDALTPPALQVPLLFLLPVLLAAWCGDLAWSLVLALVCPWTWLVLGLGAAAPPWPVWIEGLNALERTLVMGGAALLITAVQRQALRLALERDPRLPRRM